MFKSSIAAVLVLSSLSFTAAAEERDCSKAAAGSLRYLSITNPPQVEASSPIDDENRSAILNVLEKKGARGLGMTPMQHQQLVNDIKNQNAKYKHFILKTTTGKIFLAFTNAVSCAPFDPIALN